MNHSKIGAAGQRDRELYCTTCGEFGGGCGCEESGVDFTHETQDTQDFTHDTQELPGPGAGYGDQDTDTPPRKLLGLMGKVSRPLMGKVSRQVGEVMEAAIDAAMAEEDWRRGVFRLAVVLMAVPEIGEDDRETALRDYYRRTKPALVEWDEIWGEYLTAEGRVEHPAMLVAAKAMARAEETPAFASRLPLSWQALIRLCVVLQRFAGDGFFPLSTEEAGKAMGDLSKMTGSNTLRELERRGFLVRGPRPLHASGRPMTTLEMRDAKRADERRGKKGVSDEWRYFPNGAPKSYVAPAATARPEPAAEATVTSEAEPAEVAAAAGLELRVDGTDEWVIVDPAAEPEEWSLGSVPAGYLGCYQPSKRRWYPRSGSAEEMDFREAIRRAARAGDRWPTAEE